MKGAILLLILGFCGAAEVYQNACANQCQFVKCPEGYRCARYSCACSVACVKASPITVRACEHANLSISCQGKGTIRISAANYGRRLSNLCTGGPNLSNTNCGNSIVSRKAVADKCEGKVSCVIAAENSVFGDPCVGTFKYLEVQYFCSW